MYNYNDLNSSEALVNRLRNELREAEEEADNWEFTHKRSNKQLESKIEYLRDQLEEAEVDLHAITDDIDSRDIF